MCLLCMHLQNVALAGALLIYLGRPKKVKVN